jgi:hypothetical protein
MTRKREMRFARLRPIAFLLLTCPIFLYSSLARDGDMASQESKECLVARIAERYIALHYPDFDSIRTPPIVHDKGTFWEVEYQLPEGTIGGTPVVLIDKATLRVIRAYRTQ